MPKYALIFIVIAAFLAIASGIWVAIALISEVSKSKADIDRINAEIESENQSTSV